MCIRDSFDSVSLGIIFNDVNVGVIMRRSLCLSVKLYYTNKNIKEQIQDGYKENSLCRFDPPVSLPERKRVELKSQFQLLPKGGLGDLKISILVV